MHGRLKCWGFKEGEKTFVTNFVRELVFKNLNYKVNIE